MFTIPDNILEYFFVEIKKKSKFDTVFNGNSALIVPREKQQYYKPNICIKNIQDFEVALIEYTIALNEFYSQNNNLLSHHDLSFFFNNLFSNMTFSDADDLTLFVNKRTTFFKNKQFPDLDTPRILMEKNGVKYYAQRVLECPGLETPYVLEFFMDVDGVIYNLPLVRYAFDEENVCHLFAVQYGRDRIVEFDDTFKNIVNGQNTGINKYRNVSPSFVLSFSLFLKLLEEENVTKIVVPDFLYGRYRKYYGASSEKKSNMILERILNNFIRLMQRMEMQVDNFFIEAYPNEIDSYMHIIINKEKELVRTLANEESVK